jgi:hypothetical protein
MKKLVTFATAASMLAFIACGPSADEKMKAEQHVKDSTRIADSTAKVAAMMKMKADSMKAAAMKADTNKKDTGAHK